MKFDIFGRRTLEIVRSQNQWLAFECGNEGKKRKAWDIQIPDELKEHELCDYLSDIYHEWASAHSQSVKQLGG